MWSERGEKREESVAKQQSSVEGGGRGVKKKACWIREVDKKHKRPIRGQREQQKEDHVFSVRSSDG